MINDTIAGIATALGEGGVGIIRVSGQRAVHIVDSIFRGKQKLSTVASHTVTYGHVVDKDDHMIDEVLVPVFHKPRSYTMEDVVEIHCHGGIMPVRKVLEAVLDAGARLAEPGEFTKRAFINGRIDLSQAEAIMDLIRAKTDLSMQAAMSQINGSISKQVRDMRQSLLELIAHIEVTIDYPEHDVEEVTREQVLTTSQDVLNSVEQLLSNSEQGKILREGISAAIIGRPNVGKSSLLNALLHENRAIVTDIPGTTRDLLEEYINVRGIAVRIMDTAGIRTTEDVVEQIGVERSRKALEEADLVLLMLNTAESLSEYDKELMQAIAGKKAIILLNKMDLASAFSVEVLQQYIAYPIPIISISALHEQGIELLYNEIERLFINESFRNSDFSFVTNQRHIALLKSAKASIGDAIAGAENDLPIDIVAIDIRNSWETLGEILGESLGEGIIDQLFSQFCLGK